MRFDINSPESSQGSLEVFNVLGQKVKTVYQGHFFSGTQLFELNVPEGIRSTLIYRLSVNGKQVTGKLMSARD
ncbi:MAG: T9SS type A sorting domain-containing protein [Chitinophagaceae bacterium]|nr:T9SS type A sorting domain-containing protein [Chitinophagaceae bacterium]